MKKLIAALLLTTITAVPALAKEDMTVQSCKDVEGLTTTKIRELHGGSDKFDDKNDRVEYWNDNVYAVLNKKAITVSETICIPLKPEQQVKAFPVPIKQLPAAEIEAVKAALPAINTLAGLVNKGMEKNRVFDNYFKPFISNHYKTPFNEIPREKMFKTLVFYNLPTFHFKSVQDILSENGYTIVKNGETQMQAAKNSIIYNIYIPSQQGQKYAGRTAKLESIVISGKTYFITVKKQLENGKAYEAYIATQKIIATNDIGRDERMDLAANYREYGLSFHDIGKGNLLLIHNNDGIADVKE